MDNEEVIKKLKIYKQLLSQHMKFDEMIKKQLGKSEKMYILIRKNLE